jgi:hypothetical protein
VRQRDHTTSFRHTDNEEIVKGESSKCSPASIMADQSQHVVQIPQAVNIAASQEPSISPELRQEAIGYLAKVKELSEETWKVRVSSYGS